MKKIICVLLCLLLASSAVACAKNEKNVEGGNMSKVENNKTLNGPYMIRSADWPIYDTSDSLVDAADMVFIGRITEIEFQVLDAANALPVSDSTSEYARELYTIYNVEVVTSYKGDTTKVSKIRVMGGMVDYEAEQQLQVMEEGEAFAIEAGIPIWDNYEKVQCELGGTYLFVLKQFDTGYPTIVNLEQAVFSVDDPTKKRTIGNNLNTYYSGDIDEFNNPLISVEDIITEFGKDMLDEFVQNWENGVYADRG